MEGKSFNDPKPRLPHEKTEAQNNVDKFADKSIEVADKIADKARVGFKKFNKKKIGNFFKW